MGVWSKGFDGFKAQTKAGRMKMIVSLCPAYVVSDPDRKAKNGDGSPSASQKDSTLTWFLVSQALVSKYPPTPEMAMRGVTVGKIKANDAKKIVGKLQNVFQNAVNEEEDSVVLDQTQAEWVRDLIGEWDVDTNWACWRITLFEHLDETITKALSAEKLAKEAAKAPANGSEKHAPEAVKA